MELTLGQFIDNMEKNGYKQIKMQLWGYNANTNERDIHKYGACALGQAIYNTFGVQKLPQGLDDGLWKIRRVDENYEEINPYQLAAKLNDLADFSIPAIAARLRKTFAQDLDIVVYSDQ